jgi:hypothetical protein
MSAPTDRADLDALLAEANDIVQGLGDSGYLYPPKAARIIRGLVAAVEAAREDKAIADVVRGIADDALGHIWSREAHRTYAAILKAVKAAKERTV